MIIYPTTDIVKNANKRGQLIVIEGPDAVGKATQTELLVRRLKRAGRFVHQISFPQYGRRSSRLAELYLGGTFGPAATVRPFLAATFFLSDQVAARSRLRGWLRAGHTVVADRYVPSNVVHQGAKIANKTARQAFTQWLENLSYTTLGLPKPTVVILLDVPNPIREKLTRKRGRQDGHEKNPTYMRRVSTVYRSLCRQEHWVRIACAVRGRMRTKDSIANNIWEIIQVFNDQ